MQAKYLKRKLLSILGLCLSTNVYFAQAIDLGPFSAPLLGPPIKTTSQQSCIADRYAIVSTSGVIHFFGINGNEMSAEKIRLDQSVGNPIFAIEKGPLKGAGLIAADSGSVYVVRNGSIQATLPHGSPPNGLPSRRFTTAAQFDDFTFVFGTNENEAAYVNMSTRKAKLIQLGDKLSNDFEILSQPLVVDGTVYLTSNDGHVYKIKRNYSVSSIYLREPVSAPAIQIADDELIVGTEKGNLLSLNLNLESGRFKGTSFGGSINKNSMKKYGNFLFVSSWSSTIGARVGLINLKTNSAFSFRPDGVIDYGVYHYHKRGEDFFLMVDENGKGYLRDSRMMHRGSFNVGDEPCGEPFSFGSRIVVPTVSGKLAVVDLEIDEKVEESSQLQGFEKAK